MRRVLLAKHVNRYQGLSTVLYSLLFLYRRGERALPIWTSRTRNKARQSPAARLPGDRNELHRWQIRPYASYELLFQLLVVPKLNRLGVSSSSHHQLGCSHWNIARDNVQQTHTLPQQKLSVDGERPQNTASPRPTIYGVEQQGHRALRQVSPSHFPISWFGTAHASGRMPGSTTVGAKCPQHVPVASLE